MWGWIFLIVFLAWAARRLFGGYSAPDSSLRVLAAREVAFLDAAAEAMFPAGSEIPLSGRQANLPGYVDGWLVLLPGRQRLLRSCCAPSTSGCSMNEDARRPRRCLRS